MSIRRRYRRRGIPLAVATSGHAKHEPERGAEIVELHDHGDSTIAVMRMRGHAAESDTPVDAAAWQVTQFRHGKCIRWRAYTSEREALEAVGLRE